MAKIASLAPGTVHDTENGANSGTWERQKTIKPVGPPEEGGLQRRAAVSPGEHLL